MIGLRSPILTIDILEKRTETIPEENAGLLPALSLDPQMLQETPSERREVEAVSLHAYAVDLVG